MNWKLGLLAGMAGLFASKLLDELFGPPHGLRIVLLLMAIAAVRSAFPSRATDAQGRARSKAKVRQRSRH